MVFDSSCAVKFKSIQLIYNIASNLSKIRHLHCKNLILSLKRVTQKTLADFYSWIFWLSINLGWNFFASFNILIYAVTENDVNSIPRQFLDKDMKQAKESSL